MIAASRLVPASPTPDFEQTIDATMQTLLTSPQIAERVQALGRDISRDFQSRPLTVVGVLHGSVVFVADLIRAISTPHQLGFVTASSYRGTATSPTELRLDLESLPDLAGRDVLLVDDIFDTGRTLATLVDRIAARKPAEIRTAVLLWKKDRTETALRPDYVGFEIPDRFVVGYGLDYNGDYRHLPFIGTLD
jgi:hypoxanthine phosphoribosyltransferase